MIRVGLYLHSRSGLIWTFFDALISQALHLPVAVAVAVDFHWIRSLQSVEVVQRIVCF